MAKKAGAAAKSATSAPETATGVAVQETPAIKILSPEEYEIEMEKKIAGELTKYSLPDTAIAELKTKYAGLTVTDITDKKAIKALKEALSDVVSTRTGIEAKRKDINAEYQRVVKDVNAEAKRLTELISEIEQPLREEKERVDALEKEEKERKEKEDAEKLNNRVATLKENGMEFDGSFYSIANISMDIVTIKAMKDSEFDFLVAKVGLEAERIRKENEEKERLRLEQEEADRKEREEFAAKQKQLDDERAEFQRKQDEFAEQQRKAQEQEEERRKDQLAELVGNRTHTLEGLGFTYKPSTKQFIFEKSGGTAVLDMAIVETATGVFFVEKVGELKSRITEIETATAQIEEEKAEQQRQQAIADQKRKDDEAEAERNRLAEEQRLADEKAAELEEQRKAALPDVEKVSGYVDYLYSVKQPEVTSPEMVAYLEAIKEYFEECQKLLSEELQDLKPGE